MTPTTFLRLLTGDLLAPDGNPVLDSDASSRLLIYMTGHGGDEFLKFHDVLELSSNDIAAALSEVRGGGLGG